jgi:hypothetical protein
MTTMSELSSETQHNQNNDEEPSSIATVEVYMKITSDVFEDTALDHRQHDAAQELLQHYKESLPSRATGTVTNPFLVGDSNNPLSPPPTSSKSRQGHLLLDKHGNHKKFGSALGLLTARFMQRILVRFKK